MPKKYVDLNEAVEILTGTNVSNSRFQGVIYEVVYV